MTTICHLQCFIHVIHKCLLSTQQKTTKKRPQDLMSECISVEAGKKWIQVEVTWTDFLVRSTKSFLSWSSLSPSLNFPGFDSTMPEPVKDPPTKQLNQCYTSYKSDTWYLTQTLWRISQMQRWHQNQMWRLIHTWMFRWPLSRDSFGMTAVQLHLLLEGLVLWCWPGIALNFRYSDNL